MSNKSDTIKVGFEISKFAHQRIAMFCLKHDIPREWVYRSLLENAAMQRSTKELVLKKWIQRPRKVR